MRTALRFRSTFINPRLPVGGGLLTALGMTAILLGLFFYPGATMTLGQMPPEMMDVVDDGDGDGDEREREAESHSSAETQAMKMPLQAKEEIAPHAPAAPPPNDTCAGVIPLQLNRPQ